MLARTHLMRIQRAMYEKLRDHARDHVGGLSPELRKYFQEYQREFQDFKSISAKPELLSALLRCDIAICGDYHTLSQAQRTVIRLLSDCLPKLRQAGKQPIMLLEMATPADNRYLEAYLKGKLTEPAFLKAIRFEKNWGFDWANYRRLFDFARREGIKVLGLNGPKAKSLAARDKFAAQVIADTARENPQGLVVVLIGDLHLAQSHLPSKVKARLARHSLNKRLLTIHQNHERFYWQLAERGLEQRVDVLKVRDHIFCIMNTPPWIKLQSHLKWNELITEMPKAPLARKWDSALDEVDSAEDIREALHLIRCFFQLPEVANDDFSLVTQADRSLLARLKRYERYTPIQVKILSRLLKEFKSQFIPKGNLIYLSTLNLNHSAAQGSTYLHAKLSGLDRLFEKPQRDFYPFIWIEALAFLGSKMVNHKRKCNGIANLEALAAQVTIKSKTYGLDRLALLVTRHIQAETKLRSAFAFSLPKKSASAEQVVFYYKGAKLLGALLGQALYFGLIEGNVSKPELAQLFSTPFHELAQGQTRSLYLSWLQRLDRFGYRRMDKAERF